VSILDGLPAGLRKVILGSRMYRNINWSGVRADYDDLRSVNNLKDAEDRVETSDLALAEVVSSRIVGLDAHRLMLDLDVPAELIASSTPGHSHLYVDVAMTWDKLEPLLRALGDAGIIETGYAKVSIARKQTFLRLPWVKKGFETFRGTPESVEEFLAS